MISRKLIKFFTLCILFLLTICAFNVYLNNKQAEWPTEKKIDKALVKSIDWLHEKKSFIEQKHNPGLWWMLKEASDITDKPELIEIYTDYKRNYLNKRPPNIWTPYFQPTFKPKAPDILEIMDLDKYQVFFIYALSCDNALYEEPLVKKQFNANFCSPYFIHPRCVTHQQMAIRLLQRSDCGDQTKLSDLSTQLLNIIKRELTWDFRVGDAYLQRSLMLAEAGRFDLIKPVWIQRIIEEQNPDGGWDDVHTILPLGWDVVIGLSSKMPVIKKEISTFHATAQGVWLLSLLQQHYKNNVSTMGTASN